MARKPTETNDGRPIRRLLLRLINAPAVLSVIWPALLLCGGYLAWDRWGAAHVAKNLYGLDPTSIQLSEKPTWIKSDIVSQVHQDTWLKDLSLLDPQATAKIATAFSMNPWIDEVKSINKLPGGTINVRVRYRRPVAMVYVDGTHPDTVDQGLLPVDAKGVLLPPGDFSPAEAMSYIQIDVPGLGVTAPAGQPFRRSEVSAAAALASILVDYREQLSVVAIGVHGDPRLKEIPQLEIAIEEPASAPDQPPKRYVHFWGSPPGQEIGQEPTVEAKLAMLMRGLQQNTDLRIASLPTR
ncbi:MAG: hypothetical protein AAGA03_13570 [Planctomycetota bacterium]